MLSPTDFAHRFHIEYLDGEKYLVNRNSGHISHLNETAAITLDLLIAGLSQTEIVNAIAETTQTEAHEVTPAVAKLLENLRTDDTKAQEPYTFISGNSCPDARNFIRSTYYLNGIKFGIAINDAGTFEENDCLLDNLKSIDDAATQHEIVIDCHDDYVELFVDGAAYLATDDDAWLNGMLRSCMIKLAYNANTKSLMVFHAAGLVRQNQAVLLVGPSGAGKSTLSTELCLRHWRYLGDDSLPIDLDQNLAFSMATNISLKTDSWPLFSKAIPALDHAPVRRSFVKPMKTIKPPNQNALDTSATPIAAIVFSRHSETEAEQMKAISVQQALANIQTAETKFDPDTIDVIPRALLHWLHKVPKYSMSYQSLDTAEQYLLHTMAVD